MHEIGRASSPISASRELAAGARIAWLFGLLGSPLAGCSGSPPDAMEVPRMQAEAIIGSDGGVSDVTGISLVTNASGDVACSGALIAPTLVLTALHCVFGSGPTGDEPLPATSFVVGFGPREGSLVSRAVDAVDWPPELGAGPLSTSAAQAAGEDVAVLHLTEPAPPGERIHDVDLVFSPADQQPVDLAGYGISDVATDISGIRETAPAAISVFDVATGIVQTSGAQACFGDSGGPLLRSGDQAILGVISQIAAGDGAACSSGLTFADTAANAVVQRFLARECASAGGCGGAADGNALRSSGSDAALDEAGEVMLVDGGLDGLRALEAAAPDNAGASGGTADASSEEMLRATGSACSATTPGSAPPGSGLLVAGWSFAFAAVRRARVALRPAHHPIATSM